MLWIKLRRDIFRYKGMFLGIVVTVFIGVMVFVSTYSSYRNLDESYAKTFNELGMANLTVAGGNVDAFAQRAATTEGVQDVATRTVADVPLRLNGEDTLLGRIVGMPLDQQPKVNAIDMLDGSYLSSAQPNGVVLEQHLNDEWKLKPGDRLEILGKAGWQPVTMQGEALSPEYLWPTRSRQDTMPLPEDYGVVFLSQTLAEKITGASPNEAVIAYDNGDDNPATASQLTQMAQSMGAGTVGVQTQEDQPSNAFLRTDIDAFGNMSKVFPLVFLIAAAIAAYVLLTRRVHAERPVIGTLLAHGVRRRSIVTHYLAFGLIAGMLGAIPGVAAGAGLAGFITSGYAGFMKLESVVKDVYSEAIIGGLAFGLVTGAVAAALPALLASRITPADAMRSAAPPGRARASFVERFFPGLGRLPVGGRVVMRNLERNRRRSAFTMIGVGMALSIVLVAWGSVDSMNTWMDRHFNKVAKQDSRVIYDGASPSQGDLDEIAAVPGVKAVERTYNVPASFTGPGGRYDTFLVGLKQNTIMHGFRHHEGAQWPLSSEGVIVGRELEEETGASVGDKITAVLPGSGKQVDLEIAGFVDEPMGTLVYLPLDRFAETVGPEALALPGIGSALVEYNGGVDRDKVGAAISQLSGVATVEDSRGLYDLVDEWMAIMYGFAAVMLIFGCMMAFALIFIMMTVNIAERSDEMGTMQAVGVPHRKLSRLLMGENLALAVVGIAPGLIGGSLLVDLVMSSYINDMWRFEGVILPLTAIVSAVGIMLVALLSQGPSIRAIRKLDLVGIVRERGV